MNFIRGQGSRCRDRQARAPSLLHSDDGMAMRHGPPLRDKKMDSRLCNALPRQLGQIGGKGRIIELERYERRSRPVSASDRCLREPALPALSSLHTRSTA